MPSAADMRGATARNAGVVGASSGPGAVHALFGMTMASQIRGANGRAAIQLLSEACRMVCVPTEALVVFVECTSQAAAGLVEEHSYGVCFVKALGMLSAVYLMARCFFRMLEAWLGVPTSPRLRSRVRRARCSFWLSPRGRSSASA